MLHQLGDYGLRKTVAQIRAYFESRKLNAVRRIPDSANYTDFLIKRNIPMSKELNLLFQKEYWNVIETARL